MQIDEEQFEKRVAFAIREYADSIPRGSCMTCEHGCESRDGCGGLYWSPYVDDAVVEKIRAEVREDMETEQEEAWLEQEEHDRELEEMDAEIDREEQEAEG